MNLFLDASAVLAACGRPAGASRAVFEIASRNGWRLMIRHSRKISRKERKAEKLISELGVLPMSLRTRRVHDQISELRALRGLRGEQNKLPPGTLSTQNRSKHF